MEEEKVVKNINNRIIIPCQRITQVQDGVKALHAQADKFEEYLSSIKGSKDNRRARARYAHRSKPKHMSTAEPMPVKGSQQGSPSPPSPMLREFDKTSTKFNAGQPPRHA